MSTCNKRSQRMFSSTFDYSQKLSNILILLFGSLIVTLTTLYYYQTSLYNNLLNYSGNAQFNKNYLDSAIQESDVQNGYIVWGSTCRIPNVSPFHDSIKKFVFKWKSPICSTREPLTYTLYNPETQQHRIIVNKTALPAYEIRGSDIECCYQSITRKYIEKKIYNNMDDRYDATDFVCFKNQINLPKETEFVYLKCSTKSSSTPVFKTIHGMVANKPLVVKPNGNKTYSVLLLGIDSIARLNMIRTMPKTWQYLKENQWISLEGYNKIGENTLPNLGAILTGFSYNDLRKVCWKNDYDVFDECPFIWKEYKQKSYVTAYVEDSPEIGTFNYEKIGFRNSPTDYYARPLMCLGMDKLKIQLDGNRAYCMGESTQAEYLLKYTTEFAQHFHNHSYFNLFWLNSFSHDKLNQPQTFDLRYRKFLQDLQPYLNSTIVIFFSDHGMRFGEIRQTYVGWLEERMPFITFLLPPSFKENYPDKYENLAYNTNRLTSPYDVHATLQDILYGSVQRKPHSCPTCDSLFSKTQFNRTCEQAGISWHWCTCESNSETRSVADLAVISNTRYVINELNKYMMNNVHKIRTNSSCAVLSLRKIMSVRTLAAASLFSESTSYIIVFATEPSNAIFEASVQSLSEFNIENSISRINAYGTQSSCVLHASVLKTICFCVENSNK